MFVIIDGQLKAKRFKNSPSKRGYLHVLTPKWIEDKIKVTARFFKYKMTEYDLLAQEIEVLRKEVMMKNVDFNVQDITEESKK